MILIIMLDTIGLGLLAFAGLLLNIVRKQGDLFTQLKAAERGEGDIQRAVAILIFLGGLMLIAGIALGFKGQ